MLVSIIIPAYNVEKYIGRCLDSIANQTYKNIEVLIINDGSTDSTEEEIKKYLYNKNFKYIKKENGGVSSARNLGLDLARGHYISFIDSDDTVEPDYIEKLLNNISDDDSFCVSNGLYKVIDNKKEPYKILDDSIKLVKNPSVCIRLFNKKYIDQLNLRFEKSSMGEDLEFVAKLLIYNNKFTIIDKYLYNYYMNDSSLTHTYTRHIFSVIDAVERIESFSKKYNKNLEYHDILEYINICHILLALTKNASKIDDFSIKDIINILTYVESKYPNWYNNKFIYQLNKNDIELLECLNKKEYDTLFQYLKEAI